MHILDDSRRTMGDFIRKDMGNVGDDDYHARL